MFGTRKNKTSNAPEFWLPAALRDHSDVAAFRASLSPLTERGWQDYTEQASVSGMYNRLDVLVGSYLSDAGKPSDNDSVSVLAAEILSDPERVWNAYVTIRTQDHIAGIIEAEKAAEKAEKARIRHHRCPVCGRFDDAAPIGRVKVRDLPGVRSMFSCEVCHVVAADQLRTHHAEEQIDGGRTRAQVVAAFLKTGNLTRHDRSLAGLVASASPTRERSTSSDRTIEVRPTSSARKTSGRTIVVRGSL